MQEATEVPVAWSLAPGAKRLEAEYWVSASRPLRPHHLSTGGAESDRLGYLELGALELCVYDQVHRHSVPGRQCHVLSVPNVLRTAIDPKLSFGVRESGHSVEAERPYESPHSSSSCLAASHRDPGGAAAAPRVHSPAWAARRAAHDAPCCARPANRFHAHTPVAPRKREGSSFDAETAPQGVSIASGFTDIWIGRP